MDDDFNTARVVGYLFEWVRVWNKLLDNNSARRGDIRAFLSVIDEIHATLGIFGSDATAFLTELKSKKMAAGSVSEDEIKGLIEERKQARKSKNFARSDEIRDTLLKQGIQLKDHPDGTTGWTVI